MYTSIIASLLPLLALVNTAPTPQGGSEPSQPTLQGLMSTTGALNGFVLNDAAAPASGGGKALLDGTGLPVAINIGSDISYLNPVDGETYYLTAGEGNSDYQPLLWTNSPSGVWSPGIDLVYKQDYITFIGCMSDGTNWTNATYDLYIQTTTNGALSNADSCFTTTIQQGQVFATDDARWGKWKWKGKDIPPPPADAAPGY